MPIAYISRAQPSMREAINPENTPAACAPMQATRHAPGEEGEGRSEAGGGGEGGGAGQHSTAGAGQHSTGAAGQHTPAGAGQHSTAGAGQHSTAGAAENTPAGASENTPAEAVVAFVVEPNYAGWRLDCYLKQKLGRLSRTRIQGLIRRQLGPHLKPASLLKPGMRFALRRTLPAEPSVPPPQDTALVFEDEDLLVLDKPAGLPVHPSARYFHNTLVAQLAARFRVAPHPAHRLDRETSGLMVCAKNRLAAQGLARAFADSRVHKEYLAVVEGHPLEDAFCVRAPIAEGSPNIRVAVRIAPEGKPAATQVRVLRRFFHHAEPFSLLQCVPLTGRQHQIRVHLKHHGFPLVGDKIYGPDEMFFDSFSKHALPPEAWRRLRLPRHALHANLLAFAHPRTQQPLRFEVPLPADLQHFLEKGAGGPGPA